MIGPLPQSTRITLSERGVSLGTLAEIAKQIERLPADCSCVVSGSLVEGFGNRHSDLDLYSIYAASAPPVATSIGMRPGSYVDMEHVASASLKELVERVNDPGWSWKRAEKDLDRYYRLAIALPARVTEDIRTLLKGFDRRIACERLATLARGKTRQYLARAAVAVVAEEHVVGLLALQKARLWSAAHVLALDGEGYVNTKWIAEKAARVHGRDTSAFHDLIDPIFRVPTDVRADLDALRASVTFSAEFEAQIAGSAFRLGDGVRVIVDCDNTHLVGVRSIGQVGPNLGQVCRRLAEGQSWDVSVAELAALEGASALDHQIVLALESDALRTAGLLTAVDEHD